MSELTALVLGGLLVAWLRGRDALGARAGRRGEAIAFGAGMAALVAASLSPLDGLAGRSLSAHMVQHLLLTAVAAPLLVLGRPVPTVLAGLPARWSSRLSGWHRRLRRSGAGRPGWIATAAAAHSGLIWLWHAPPLYGAALSNEAVHFLEHSTFVAAAGFFWWAVAGLGRRSTYGTGVVALFAATLPLTGLGAFMATADVPWYGHYGTGSAALDGQHMAGAVMWGFGGFGAVVAATALFAAWLLSFERTAPGWPRNWNVPAANGHGDGAPAGRSLQ